MSNHLHLVVRTTRKNLAAFMAYFKARVTETINHLTGRRGPLWARRYDAQPILDDEGTAGRVGYTLSNPLKANLVDDFEEWSGMNLAYGIGDEALNFQYLDRVQWHREHRPANLSQFFKTAKLELSPIPSCEGMSRESYRQSVIRWVEDAVAKAKAREDGVPRPPTLGVEKIVDADFNTRPKSPARSRRPNAFGSTDIVREHRRGMFELIGGYQRASDIYRSGQSTVAFPQGMYPPPILQAA